MSQPNEPLRPQRFLSPRHWPTWLGLGALRATSLLPYPLLYRLGGIFGDVLRLFARERRRVAAINIGLAFPELDAAQQRRLLRAHFRAMGRTLAEAGICWWGSADRLASLARIDGLEHLETARARGKGVLLLGAHFAGFEISAQMLHTHVPLTFMYKRQHKNPLFDEVVTRARLRRVSNAVPHDDVRAFARALRRGEVCWFLPDQDMGRRVSVFAPFMGVQAATVPAPARLARMTGAAVVPYAVLRRRDGTGYDIRIQPALEGFPSGDDTADTARINAVIEGWVHEAPEQYLWLHRRFKTRPAGEPPIYPKRRRRRRD